jgi:hypothetical protein
MFGSVLTIRRLGSLDFAVISPEIATLGRSVHVRCVSFSMTHSERQSTENEGGVTVTGNLSDPSGDGPNAAGPWICRMPDPTLTAFSVTGTEVLASVKDPGVTVKTSVALLVSLAVTSAKPALGPTFVSPRAELDAYLAKQPNCCIPPAAIVIPWVPQFT